MSTNLVWGNVVAYSLQIGLLVGLAAFVPALLRLRLPGAKLVYWQILLAACLVLPGVRAWKQEAVSGAIEVTTTINAIVPARQAAAHPLSRGEIALLLLAAGAVVRLGWLAAGFVRLRRYRRHSRPLEPAPAWGVEASLRISDEVSSPVTFGWRKPVVLLPARFPELDDRKQEAILCHEILHVRRRDWLFTVGEELVRAVFWFHPAIWWLLGEIGLAREQEVDRQAIDLTKSREEYMDALLAIAGAKPQLDLAPAPLFLRKRHLKQRVISILKEARMSKTRLISALAAGLGILAAACWLVTGTFPLMAAPQVVNDAPGVAVEMGGSTVIHRAAVPYPAAALKAGIQGTVSVEVKLDSSGNVSDAHVVAGPEELRKAALQSVMQWHFTHDAAGGTRQVNITFQTPPAGQSTAVTVTPREAVEGVMGSTVIRRETIPAPGGGGGVLGGIISSAPANGPVGATLKSITIVGLSDQSRSELLSKLPVHEGETLTPDNMNQLRRAISEFDEHLIISSMMTSRQGGSTAVEAAMTIRAPGAEQVLRPSSETIPLPAGALKVDQNAQAALLISHPQPVYPDLAKQARISGTVQLAAVIGKDGTVQQLNVISGHPLLIQSAMDAVRQWVYKPTLLNGQPVEVSTLISVNYTLAE